MDKRYMWILESVLAYMDQHFLEDIGVKEVSDKVGYSPRHCNRIFEACYGETIPVYLRNLRLDFSKTLLKELRSVNEVSRRLFFHTPDGFSRAFRLRFGISPSSYIKGEPLQESYKKNYEYRMTEQVWTKGENPTADGLWEFAYYLPSTGEYRLMPWNGSRFEVPFSVADESDPCWYCRCRSRGYGLHPGKEVQAVRTFNCPHSGKVELLFSIGRIIREKKGKTPCSVQLFLNDTPLTALEEPMILSSSDIKIFTLTCSVRKGDKIRLHLDSMGDINRSGVFIYRQRIGYLTLEETL